MNKVYQVRCMGDKTEVSSRKEVRDWISFFIERYKDREVFPVISFGEREAGVYGIPYNYTNDFDGAYRVVVGINPRSPWLELRETRHVFDGKVFTKDELVTYLAQFECTPEDMGINL